MTRIQVKEVRFDEIASVDEVARYFKVSAPTIRKWIESGHLHAINFGTDKRKLFRVLWAEVHRCAGKAESDQ